MSNTIYDAVIIGAGMSGLAAGIRLAMFEQKVLILEKHLISGGLNSYYQRGKRQFDVGLHALTNFARKEEKSKPLGKILKQLRIKYDELKLKEQSFSLIQFPKHTLKISNDFKTLLNDVEKNFPQDYQSFLKLVDLVNNFDEVSLNNPHESARLRLNAIIANAELVEMILAPLLIYGSAWENDMDFSQFVIMFKSIYLEGLSRPDGGVRTIINLLLKRFEEEKGELRFKSEVTEIKKVGDYFNVQLSNGEVVQTKKIFSSMGYPETMRLTFGAENISDKLKVGRLSFCESIFITDKKLKENLATIIFYNGKDKYAYEKPKDYFDDSSAVICFPDNFNNSELNAEGVIRITFMANYDLWDQLKKTSLTEYKKKKEEVAEAARNVVKRALPHLDFNITFQDIFTPSTIARYTSHLEGTVYGSTTKTRDGKSGVDGLYIIGTDQGFLGIIGSLLSGISIANLYGLMGDNHAV